MGLSREEYSMNRGLVQDMIEHKDYVHETPVRRENQPISRIFPTDYPKRMTDSAAYEQLPIVGRR